MQGSDDIPGHSEAVLDSDLCGGKEGSTDCQKQNLFIIKQQGQETLTSCQTQLRLGS